MFFLILPSLPFILSSIVFNGCPLLCLAGGIFETVLSKKVVIWNCKRSHKSSIITSGAPAFKFSQSLWFALIISDSLCVKSSSDLSPDSRVIEGRTVTGGTKRRVKTDHSGLHVIGLIPDFATSSSEIATNKSLISLGKSLFFPAWNVVGLSSLTFSFAVLQWGHFFMSLAFFSLFVGDNFLTSSFDIISLWHSLQ